MARHMWKLSQTVPHAIPPVPATPRLQSTARPATAVSNQSTISKGLIIAGEITGPEPLFIDGTVEGSIDLPENGVTIGRSGQVTANIAARDVVVLGTVCGSIAATNLLDIRAEASVTGDVIAARLSVEDGAFFKGGIDIRKAEAKIEGAGEPESIELAIPKPLLMALPEPGKLRMQPFPESA